MPTSRLEAFSDGVIAIAITLLVLDIHVPESGTHGGLAHELGRQWPQYLAYVTSFFTIGIIWINHHALLRRVRTIDHVTLALNLVLLMTVSLLPFTSSLVAEYLREGDGASLAAAIYGASLLAMAVGFMALQLHTLHSDALDREERIDEAARRRIVRRNAGGLLPYVVATALAPISPYATVVLCLLVAMYFALPGTTSD